MRDSNTCPKCNSTNISISQDRPLIRRGNSYDFVAFRFDSFHHTKITNYTCRNCGHIEMWITKEQLKEINEFLEGEGILI